MNKHAASNFAALDMRNLREGDDAIVRGRTYRVARVRPGWRNRGYSLVLLTQDGEAAHLHRSCECTSRDGVLRAADLVTERVADVCTSCRAVVAWRHNDQDFGAVEANDGEVPELPRASGSERGRGAGRADGDGGAAGQPDAVRRVHGRPEDAPVPGGTGEALSWPRCRGCGRRPEQIPEYTSAADEEEITAEEYVTREEGTFNPGTGRFWCTECYIEAGMPPGKA